MTVAASRATKTMVCNTGQNVLTHADLAGNSVRYWYPKPGNNATIGLANLFDTTVDPLNCTFSDPTAPNKIVTVEVDNDNVTVPGTNPGTINVNDTVEWDNVGGGFFGKVLQVRNYPTYTGYIVIQKNNPADPNPLKTDILAVDGANKRTVTSRAVPEPLPGWKIIINSITWYSPGENTDFLLGQPDAENEFDQWQLQTYQGRRVLFSYRHHFGDADSPAIYTNKMHFPNLNIETSEGFRFFCDKDANNAQGFLSVTYRVLAAGRRKRDDIPRN